jgi:hypothetical protein
MSRFICAIEWIGAITMMYVDKEAAVSFGKVTVLGFAYRVKYRSRQWKIRPRFEARISNVELCSLNTSFV